ncbi:hypothetical protein [Haloferula sp. BvORR071]|uniref:hypothetical protein n=1 Tax=Haloferula sp. BvORR071 TaxID=1396141 RepID=UPI00054F1A9C|nr:hypothetical protein [Haloferula sp. BvORR071]
MRRSLHHRLQASTLALLLGIGTAITTHAQEATKNPAPTLSDLLVSELPAELAKGEAELATGRSEIIAGLLKTIDSGEPKASAQAALELSLVISPWARGRESSERFHSTKIEIVGRPVTRPTGIPEAPAIRRSLQASIPKLLDIAAKGDSNSFFATKALKAQCETLTELADDATIDWTLKQLGKGYPSYNVAPLARLLSISLALPPFFTPGGICGNNSPEFMAEFTRQEQERLQKSRLELIGIWKELQPMGPQERIDHSIQAWRAHFLPVQQNYSGSYPLDERLWIHEDMEPLVRLGPAAVEQLRVQQTKETDLLTKCVWEAVISAITGHEDHQLVRGLFDTPGTGVSTTLRMACQIVVAAGSKDWLAELDALQTRPYMDFHLASRAIASCHREAGLPALKRGFEAIGSNYDAEYSIQELETRAAKGPPRRMSQRF